MLTIAGCIHPDVIGNQLNGLLSHQPKHYHPQNQRKNPSHILTYLPIAIYQLQFNFALQN